MKLVLMNKDQLVVTVKELPPTEKFKTYKADLYRDKQSEDKVRIERANCELALMRQSRFIGINGVVHHYHVSGPQDAEETMLLVHGWDCWWVFLMARCFNSVDKIGE